MMQRGLIILLLTGIILACGKDTPSGVLPREKMEKILWDVTRGSEFLNGYVYSRHPYLNRAAVNNEMLERILKIHKVSKKDFDKSLAYYRDHPKQLAQVLDSIIAQQKRLAGDTTTENSTEDPLRPQYMIR